MQAVKAIYKEGKIELLSPMPEVTEAELLIIVLDKNDQTSGAAKLFRAETSSSEDAFRAIGMAHFFDTEDDNNVDWEELFDVKSR